MNSTSAPLSDLTGRSRPELLPTRGNIEREIKALAKVLKRGDILFILLSGHGSQQPADFGRAGNYEPDGADEVFLTRDTNRYIREPGKPKGSFPNAIVDDDLGEWVDPLVGDQTGALVWIVMDCCHSGTGLRGERPRNPTVGTMPEAERVAAQQEARQRYRENEKKEVAFSILPESPRVAAIFACEPDDTTPEMIMVGDDWYGLLSHTLRQAMEKEPEGSKPTCLTLIDSVRGLYRDRNRVRPTPLPEGKLVKNVFLSEEEGIPPLPPIALTKAEGRMRINAGRLREIHEDTVLDVFDPGADVRSSKPVARVKVVESRVGEAFVERQDGGPEPTKGSTCVVLEKTTRNFRLPMAVDPLTVDASKPGKPLVALPDEERRRLSEELEALAKLERSPIRLANPYEEGVWLLSRPNIEADRLQLFSPGRIKAEELPQGPNLREELRKRAATIAKALNLIEIKKVWENEKENPQLNEDRNLRVSMRLVRVKDGKEVEVWDSSTAKGRSLPELVDGDLCRLYVDNKSRKDQDVDVNLLFISSSYGVKSKFPEQAKGFNTLKTNDEPLRIGFRVGASEVGIDRWMLIAVKSEPLTTTDFVYLEQDALKPEEAKDIIEKAESHRGPGGPSLKKLLIAAGFPGGEAGQRGDARPLDSSNCIVELLEYKSVPKSAESTGQPRQ